MRPHSQREKRLLQGHRMIECVSSRLDRPGLCERPYRKTRGLIFYIYAVLLGDGLLKLMAHHPAWCLLLVQLGGGGGAGCMTFPNWGECYFAPKYLK